jgi:hypothetical protein
MVMHRFARAVLLASATLALGCWPGIPVAARVIANRQDDHGSAPLRVTLSGTIVTDPTASLPAPPLAPDGDPAAGGPVLDLSASQLDFGASGTHLIVQARNTGTDSLTLGTITATPILGADTSWLTATVLADGKTIALVADRTGQAAGDYEASIDVGSNGGTDSLVVGMNVGPTTPTPIGPVIVEVLASDGLTVVARVTTTAAEGYAWSVPGLPRASYFLHAGVDLDSNGVIGEPGEPFGAYPDPTSPQLIEADLLSSIELDLLVE